jgi:membrane protein DedA with SNARE-associated domain
MNEIIHFLTEHGSLVLAAVVFGEQIGLPLPAMPFLIAAGALVGSGQMTLGMAVVLAVLAAMAGDQLWFELGRRRGRLVLNWLCRIHSSRRAASAALKTSSPVTESVR